MPLTVRPPPVAALGRVGQPPAIVGAPATRGRRRGPRWAGGFLGRAARATAGISRALARDGGGPGTPPTRGISAARAGGGRRSAPDGDARSRPSPRRPREFPRPFHKRPHGWREGARSDGPPPSPVDRRRISLSRREPPSLSRLLLRIYTGALEAPRGSPGTDHRRGVPATRLPRRRREGGAK